MAAEVKELLKRAVVAATVVDTFPLTQGAVAEAIGVRCLDGLELVVKRYHPTLRHRAIAEAAALRAVADVRGIPAPRLVGACTHPEPCVVMTYVPGTRLDRMPAVRPSTRREIGRLLREIHRISAPAGVPDADWRDVVRANVERRGPHADILAARTAHLTVTRRVLCHGDPSTANILATVDGDATTIAGIVDWERAGAGDPLWDLAVITFHAARRHPDHREELCAGYGLSRMARARLRALELTHAAALWNWWAETGEARLRKTLEAELRAALVE